MGAASRKERWWRHPRELALILILPTVIAAAIVAPVFVETRAEERQRKVVCALYAANAAELNALRAIARELGIPAKFPIPDLPEACGDLPLPPIVDATLFKARPDCTEVGTSEDDMRTTGEGNDVLCLLAGSDYGHTNGGRDVVMGGPDDDALVGGHGWDRLRAGNGNDFLFSIDGMANDVLRGAGGKDKCFADPGDTVYGCETVHLSNDPEVLDALLSMTYGALSLGEDVQTLLDSAPACGRENPPEWCG